VFELSRIRTASVDLHPLPHRSAPAEVLEQYRQRSIPFSQAKGDDENGGEPKISVGTLADRRRTGYLKRLEDVEKGLRERWARENKLGARS
jgi:hypothetical protein